MRARTMYAVVAEESFVQDAAALFNSKPAAEDYADEMSDIQLMRYVVVQVTIDANTIQDAEVTKLP